MSNQKHFSSNKSLMEAAQYQNKHEPPFKLDLPFDEALGESELGRATPFLKWVGGKRSIIEELKKRVPQGYNDYYEAFIGGGALFFELTPKKAYLSDTNLDLILTYKVIQKDVDRLIARLKEHQKKHNSAYYYKIRAWHNLDDPIEIAARMIYLNKTCFNGLWRVNARGEFNVPMGSYVNPHIVREDNLRLCAKALKSVIIEYKDYSKIEPKAGDFCYFDPPYHPATDTSFTKYSKLDFTEKDQVDLMNLSTELHEKGVHVMISNSNTKFIRDLYKASHFKIGIVNAPRLVNCKSNERSPVEEVLVTNY